MPDDFKHPPHLSEEEYRELARDQHEREGTLEIDDEATVSFSDDGGAYVQAWVWVYTPTPEETDDESVD